MLLINGANYGNYATHRKYQVGGRMSKGTEIEMMHAVSSSYQLIIQNLKYPLRYPLSLINLALHIYDE